MVEPGATDLEVCIYWPGDSTPGMLAARVCAPRLLISVMIVYNLSNPPSWQRGGACNNAGRPSLPVNGSEGGDLRYRASGPCRLLRGHARSHRALRSFQALRETLWERACPRSRRHRSGTLQR